MGKVKDEQLFSLLRDFLLIYLPNQRHASSNTVKAYRTAWNQLLKYIAEQKKISMMSVTFEMIRYEMVLAYLDWLSEEKGIGPATYAHLLLTLLPAGRSISACPVSWQRLRFRKRSVFGRWTICPRTQSRLCLRHLTPAQKWD